MLFNGQKTRDKWTHIDSPSVARGVRYFSTQESQIKILNTSRKASGWNFKFNSREWRNIVTHMGNCRVVEKSVIL
jgi:hypothetical protein